MLIRTFVASVLVCVPLFAQADCKDHFTDWARTLQPGRTVDADHAACKIWPANPAQTLAVLPLPQKGGSADQTVYDVEVLVADSKTGAIIAHSYESAAITSDAISLDSIALDTATWQLSAQNLAFGVRTSYQNSSRVNPYAATALSLYLIDGAKLRHVLSNLTTQQSNGEWDGDCAGQFSDMARAIAIGPAGHSAYATLHISEKTVDSTHTQIGDQCVSKDKAAKRVSYTLEYDGAHYNVPAALSYAQ